MKRDIEKEIRERWFKDHKAKLMDLGEIQILDWQKPGTGIYRVRYVFDGCMMYISGDVGEAVFWLTWKASIHSFDNIHIHYFDEKLRAFSDDRRDYNGETAKKRLEEWRQELSKNRRKYDLEKMKTLIEIASGCGSTREWAEVVNSIEFNDFIVRLDNDYWEWMYKIGDEIPPRLQSYLIGLKMASEQIKREGAICQGQRHS
jgi:hypothetical protein